MSRRTLPFLLMATVMVVLGAATTASASGGTGQGGVPWPGTSICADGTLAFADIGATAIVLAGTIQPCAGTDPATVSGARWTVAWYFTAADIASEGHIYRFDSATAPTPVTARFSIDYMQNSVWGSLQAGCLITTRAYRLACVEITTDASGAINVAPIPVDDPRVSVAITVHSESSGDPECGACV